MFDAAYYMLSFNTYNITPQNNVLNNNITTDSKMQEKFLQLRNIMRILCRLNSLRSISL